MSCTGAHQPLADRDTRVSLSLVVEPPLSEVQILFPKSEYNKTPPQGQVHLYGDETDAKYAAQCKSEVKNKNLEKQIIFKGTTKQLSEILTTAKICAFPSYFEGVSLAVTEAMSAGLPVIGFDYCSGVNEIIENNKNGFFVKDVDEFADKLDLLISNEKLREQMGQAAKNICTAYTMDNIMNRWITLIKNTVK